MRASLIIAAHNEGSALARTIESCIDASGELDYEIVVADDASTDASVDEVARRFPQVRIVRHAERRGVSPARVLGARAARGDAFIFLDGHVRPEHGALERLVDDLEQLSELAAVSPTIVGLDVQRWTNDPRQEGHGYGFDLGTFDCRWLPLGELRAVEGRGGRQLYESPALIGCAFGVSRQLYDKVWGFDPQMQFWGVEDLDFSLKCWLLGHRVLHDPRVVIGHRFREQFDNYTVSVEHVLVNQLRLARKHYTHGVWAQWLDGARQRATGAQPGHPEGVWAQAWTLFNATRESAEQERAYLHSRRVRDELWYAERFGLAWPRLQAAPGVGAGAGAPLTAAAVFASPAPSRPPTCQVTGIVPGAATLLVGANQTFTAQGTALSTVQWTTTGGGAPATGIGPTFTTRWTTPGVKQVTATCGGASRVATATVVSPQVQITVPTPIIRLTLSETFHATLTPNTAPATNFKFEIKRVAQATWTQLATGPSNSFVFKAKIAGHFNVRVTATVNGLPVVSPPKNLEVQFPSFADVVADATVQTLTDASWTSTKNAATATSRREEGFWLRLDTNTGTFAKTATILGPVVGPTQTGSVVLGARPADTPATPALDASAVYSVASFHTHTPTTFRPVGRPVGPSGADNAADTADDVTGVVYDYVENPGGSGAIPAAHPLNSAAQRYHSGPTQRKTPP